MSNETLPFSRDGFDHAKALSGNMTEGIASREPRPERTMANS
jgi:hypothetical protein